MSLKAVDHAGAAVELDVVLRCADLGVAGRDDQVLIEDGRADVAGRQPAGVQGIQVEIDHDLPPFAAPGGRHPRALHGAQPLDDEIVGSSRRVCCSVSVSLLTAICTIGTLVAL